MIDAWFLTRPRGWTQRSKPDKTAALSAPAAVWWCKEMPRDRKMYIKPQLWCDTISYNINKVSLFISCKLHCSSWDTKHFQDTLWLILWELIEWDKGWIYMCSVCCSVSVQFNNVCGLIHTLILVSSCRFTADKTVDVVFRHGGPFSATEAGQPAHLPKNMI